MGVCNREHADGLWGGTGMIRAFVFDLDGTLVETEELKALSYARAATELRPDLDEGEVIEAFTDLVGLARREVAVRSEEHTSELQSRQYLVCRLLLEKKNHTNLKYISK